jgi:hypothetical protein
MKRFLIICLVLTACMSSCTKLIKNEHVVLESEKATYTQLANFEVQVNSNQIIIAPNDLIGFWVGSFHATNEFKQIALNDDGQLSWHTEDKITIAIESIKNNNVKGFTVVAGLTNKFTGILQDNVDNFVLQIKQTGKEIGIGEFFLSIDKNQDYLQGEWTSLNQIEIPKRTCRLEKRVFTYDPNVVFSPTRKDMTDSLLSTFVAQPDDYSEIYDAISMPSELIFTANPSKVKLSEDDVSGLSIGSLILLRNTIFARHGYAFKKRPLRIFFEDQDWYIPISSNPKQGLTPVEKYNIKMLERYEKNYREYENFAR